MGGPGWSTRAPEAKILYALRDGEWVQLADIAMRLPRYTVSQCSHGVKAAYAAGLVESKKEGARRLYRIAK